MSTKEFLESPDYHEPWINRGPLVRLNDRLNPLAKHDIDVFVKVMHHGARTGKNAPVRRMIHKGIQQGKVKPGGWIVDSSSGNTAREICLEAARLGFKALVVVPNDIAPGKLLPLLLAGAEVVSASDRDPSEVAREKAAERNGFYLDQYRNPDNSEGHELVTGMQILQDTNRRVNAFVAMVGTGGTISGVKQCFVKQGQKAFFVSAICAPGQAIPGSRDPDRLKGVTLPWADVDEVCEVMDRNAYYFAHQFSFDVSVGITTGGAAWATYYVLGRKVRDGSIDELRDETGRITVVIPSIDSLAPYYEKVSTKLFPPEFPRQQLRIPEQAA